MRGLAVAAVIIVLCTPGCTGKPAQPEGRVRVYVSIPPLAYFVERIGGEHVEVEVLVQPGQSPHSYEPTPQQMAKLSGAQVYFAAGLPFEKTLLPKIRGSNKDLKVIELYENSGHAGSEHEEHAAHDHSGKDPHFWLNPDFAAKTITASVASALAELDPQHSEHFFKSARALREELDLLSKRISRALSGAEHREFYVFHPAFGHFAEAYGLAQVAIERHGKEPSARELAGLIERAKNSGVKVIFVQPQFASGSAEAVARAIGARIETLDPLAKDYVSNIQVIARKITAAAGAGWPQDERN